MAGREVGWLILTPSEPVTGRKLGVVLALHGKGGNHRDVLDLVPTDGTGRPRFNGFAIASLDCGGGYFHPRSDGTDAGALVGDEFLPLLIQRGFDTGRLVLWGWSMGGYGALLLSATRLRGRVAAVATMSAALWTSPGASAPGAFESADDFRRHDVFMMRDVLTQTPLRLVCGLSDPFLQANQEFVDGKPMGSAFTPGGHDNAYWSAAAPDQLSFAAEHLH